MKKKEIRVRCWIDIDGVKFFGPGRAELLELVDETGSISKAAKAMGMSYKKAWAMIGELNSMSGKPYVIMHKGGDKGGGAELTPLAKKMIVSFNKLMDKLNSVVSQNADLLRLI